MPKRPAPRKKPAAKKPAAKTTSTSEPVGLERLSETAQELNAMHAADCQEMVPRQDLASLTGDSKLAIENTLKKLVRGTLFFVEQHQVSNRYFYCGYASTSSTPSRLSQA